MPGIPTVNPGKPINTGGSGSGDTPDYEIVQGQTVGHGGGGGAACDGGHGNTDGGGGAGFVVGLMRNVNFYKSNSTSTTNTDFNFTVNGQTVSHVYAMVLCGGSGSGNQPSRLGSLSNVINSQPGGAGGGAWGSGGSMAANQSISPYAGPGGNFGKGGNSNGQEQGQGGAGAWAIIDYTSGTFSSGLGGGDNTTTGYAELRWIESKQPYYNVKFKFFVEEPITVTVYVGIEEFGTVTVDPEHNEVWVPNVDEGTNIKLEKVGTTQMKEYVLTYNNIRTGINVSFD